MKRVALHAYLLMVLFLPLGALGAEPLSRRITGPITAKVVRVIDGDTVEVLAYPWPQQSVDVLVRLRGIDAPELHGSCEVERQLAFAARQRLSDMLAGEAPVILTDISGGKYFGRVVADLELATGEDAASTLILEDLVRPYDGGRKPPPEC